MKTEKVGALTKCQVCMGSKIVPVLSFGHQPIVQEYLTETMLHEPEATYPLNLVHCRSCGLSQLDYIVEPEKVFPKDYPYRTGLTNMLVRNFKQLADTLEAGGFFGRGDLIVDIGSNDGSLLGPFQEKGARVLGVEPTDAAKDANKRGIQTIQDFFGASAVKRILKTYGTAKIVTATNVFAHINDTAALVKNVKALMGGDSVFVSESQYLMDTVKKTEFDCIYHEHLRFYTLKPFMRLMEMYGMSVVDAERISAAGGSIRILAKKGRHPLSPRARKLLAAEKKAGLYDIKMLEAFGLRAHRAKRDLVALLLECKKKGRIVGLGSPARSNTLLGFARIDASMLDYLCEKKGSPKIGMYSPGTHIPVVDETRLLKEQPEYALLLSWHIGKELMKIMRTKGYRGSFIIPLPRPHVINQ
ncbi:MAG: class I SAM-dependent methyltransferase [bacterium]|nr:class I SAM-dependent methyltransferase [bacterium]